MTINRGNQHTVGSRWKLGPNEHAHSFLNNRLYNSCKKMWLCPHVEGGFLRVHFLCCFHFLFKCVKPSQTSRVLSCQQERAEKRNGGIHGAGYIPHIYGFTSSLSVLAWFLLQGNMETVFSWTECRQNRNKWSKNMVLLAWKENCKKLKICDYMEERKIFNYRAWVLVDLTIKPNNRRRLHWI